MGKKNYSIYPGVIPSGVMKEPTKTSSFVAFKYFLIA